MGQLQFIILYHNIKILQSFVRKLKDKNNIFLYVLDRRGELIDYMHLVELIYLFFIFMFLKGTK